MRAPESLSALIADESTRVAADLRAAGVREVDDGLRRRAEYSTDASNYRVVPEVVVFPRDVDEVAVTLATARAAQVPVTVRGGGTSTAGNAVGQGVVIDFSRYLNRVLSIDPDARTATVQPGAVLDDISAAAAEHGLRFGPDPSTHARATIGGAIANNACGARALSYGRTADNVLALNLLAADGTRFTAGRYGADEMRSDGPEQPLLSSLQAIVDDRQGLIRSEFGRFSRQVSGYSLEHLLPERGRDLAKFMVGSEGTLAVLLGATVRLVPGPKHVALAVLGYADMPSAAEAVPGLLAHQPIALEGINSQLVDVVRRRRGQSAVPTLPRGRSWLLVEAQGETAEAAQTAARRLAADGGAVDWMVVSGTPAAALWRLREDGAGLGGRTPSGAPAWPGWEDAAVPVPALPDYLRDFDALMNDFGLEGLTYGHFGEGCVHVRIDFPFDAAPDVFPRFVTASAELVARHGGSLSGEHGDGRARSELLPLMYSEGAIDTFGQVKHAFDPNNLLNPGVLVNPRPVDADLRVPAARAIRDSLGFSYPDDDADFSVAVHRCVGVGKCRVGHGGDGVMCPSFRATGDEKDSTRGRARVLQELVNGSLVQGFDSPEVEEALDLCLSCKGCLSDCPAGVDMASYKSEVLYQRYRGRRRPASHYVLGRLAQHARLASRAPRLANRLMDNRFTSAALKRISGVDSRRALPEFAHQTFRQWFEHHPVAQGSPVCLWLDTFTEYFSPEIGQAAVRVLESAGYSVSILSQPACCGLTWISTGQLDGAKAQLRRSLDLLAPALLAGTPIIGLEPSCVAVFRHDAPKLLPDSELAHVAESSVRTLAELLVSTESWTAPSLAGIDIVVQPHCHQHAVMGFETDQALLTAAGASVTTVSGCCGMAGNFGVERGHYDISVAVAGSALLPAIRGAGDASVLVADGFSCRTQVEQLAGVTPLHLAQLLASHLH